MLKLDPPEKLDFAKPQEWPDWKQRFERFRCATKLNKEDEVLQINALFTRWGKRQNTYSKSLHLPRATKRSRPRSLRNSTSTSYRRKILFTRAHVFIAAYKEKEKPWKLSFEVCTSWLNIVTSEHREMSKLETHEIRFEARHCDTNGA